jgi:hypothetical protein
MSGSEQLEDEVRSGVTRRKVWQGFLDWLRPIDHEVSVPQSAMSPVSASADPVVSLGAVARTSSGEALSGELAQMFFDEEALPEIDEAELLEFLAADEDPVQADPEFRDELRDRLWTLVHEGAFTRPKDH